MLTWDQTYASFETACGTTTWDLHAGNADGVGFDVGSVTVKNDADYLYVTYTLHNCFWTIWLS
jgi:hypothetical protein